MVNKAYLLGNLGSDPKIIFTKNGLSIANFNIATSEYWIDNNGNKKIVTEWHRIVAFGTLAEYCNKYLSKGSRVYIEGKIQTKQWTDKKGIKRYTTQIVPKQIEIIPSKNKLKENDNIHKKQENYYENERPEVWRAADWADHLGCDEDDVDDFFESQMC